MSTTINTTNANKETVRQAFDALFNQRDYASAERFWAEEYVQHSAHIPRVATASST